MTFNTAHGLSGPFGGMTSFANTSIAQILRQDVNDNTVSDTTLINAFLNFTNCPSSNQKCEFWCIANQLDSSHSRALCLQTQGDLVDPIPTPYLLGGVPSGLASTTGGYNNIIHRLQFDLNAEQPCFTGDTTGQNMYVGYVQN
jgi:hypothetical protein